MQTKDTKYWAEGGIVSKSGEVSAEMICKKDDVGQMAVENFVEDDETTEEKKALQFALVRTDTLEYKTFWAAPTSFETTADSEDLIQKSFSATLLGAPDKKSGFVMPGTNP